MDELTRLKQQKEWVLQYIPKFQIEKVEWKVLDAIEFYDFLEENYVIDKEFIGLEEEYSLEFIPFGLTNTSFSLQRDHSKYLISYLKNQKGKNTILTCLCYYENFQTLEIPNLLVTFLRYIETNYFYQGLGLFKLTVHKFLELVPINPYLLITHPSYDGVLCHTFEYLKSVLERENTILVFDNIYDLKRDYLLKQKTN